MDTELQGVTFCKISEFYGNSYTVFCKPCVLQNCQLLQLLHIVKIQKKVKNQLLCIRGFSHTSNLVEIL